MLTDRRWGPPPQRGKKKIFGVLKPPPQRESQYKIGQSKQQKQTLQAAYDYIIDLVAVLSHGQPEH